MPTLSEVSKRAVNAKIKAPDDPDVTITRSGFISKPYQSLYKFEIFLLNSGMPRATVYPKGSELIYLVNSFIAFLGAGVPG